MLHHCWSACAPRDGSYPRKHSEGSKMWCSPFGTGLNQNLSLLYKKCFGWHFGKHHLNHLLYGKIHICHTIFQLFPKQGFKNCFQEQLSNICHLSNHFSKNNSHQILNPRGRVDVKSVHHVRFSQSFGKHRSVDDFGIGMAPGIPLPMVS